MTGREFRAHRLRLGLTQEALGDQLEVTRVTVGRWERNLVPVPKTVAYAVRYLALQAQGRTGAKPSR